MSLYGVIIGIAIIIGIELIQRLSKDFSYKDVVILLISTLFGARILFLLHNITEMREGAVIPYAIWDGGLAFYGALIGLIISTYFISRIKRLSFFKLSDPILLVLPLIQAIGRFGNFFNNELYGLPSNLPWSIFIPLEKRITGYESYTHFHPAFLYEAILNIISFSVLYYLRKKYEFKGLITGIYLINYSLIRILLNTVRIDNEYLWLFETSNLFSAIFLLAGILIAILSFIKR
jgi:phosphatidylglycerol---prolipoprotein diacylglyceryl transferase